MALDAQEMAVIMHPASAFAKNLLVSRVRCVRIILGRPPKQK